jgi:hypothetical protein
MWYRIKVPKRRKLLARGELGLEVKLSVENMVSTHWRSESYSSVKCLWEAWSKWKLWTSRTIDSAQWDSTLHFYVNKCRTLHFLLTSWISCHWLESSEWGLSHTIFIDMSHSILHILTFIWKQKVGLRSRDKNSAHQSLVMLSGREG